MLRRLMYWPPWGVTRPWMPRFFFGSDEWHNESVAFGLPFLGVLIYFKKDGYSVEGEQHVYAAWYTETKRGPRLNTEGRIVEDCDICQGMLRELEPMPPS